ncbi:MAG: hypothetical protein SGCHY_005212 [Lobulomycetales sp.]
MPLVTLCGYPCAGKSTRAAQLCEFLTAHGHKCSVVTDDGNADEKKLRANVLSLVERKLGQTEILILDSSNYIKVPAPASLLIRQKGFRYQLYCIAKNMSTTHCVLYTACPVEQAKSWNSKRTPKAARDEAVMDALIARFEEPDFKARWDQPLFTLLPSDDISRIGNDLALALTKPKSMVKPHKSTLPPNLAQSDYLYHVDRETRDIVQAVMDAQTQGTLGSFKIKPSDTFRVNLPADRNAGMPELMRLRKQFLSINQQVPGAPADCNIEKVRSNFIEYLNAQFLEE